MIDHTNRLTDLTDLLNRPEHRDKSLKYKIRKFINFITFNMCFKKYRY